MTEEKKHSPTPIRIISEYGQPATTRVVDPDTGELITDIEKVVVIIEPGKLTRAKVTYRKPSLDITAFIGDFYLNHVYKPKADVPEQSPPQQESE